MSAVLHSASGRQLFGLIDIAQRGGVRLRLDVTASEDLAMTLEEFQATPSAPPVPPALQALWYAAHGDWEKAHRLANGVDDTTGAWVHAYLHRKEGDLGNAAYWYRRAGQPAATDSLQAEWSRIVAALLK